MCVSHNELSEKKALPLISIYMQTFSYIESSCLPL
uniref:Uncharacterized protein n=1 Tax=Anguilla anguilla TaxID=7936 RepID=A0A0E9P6G5_ANGAN